MKANRKPRADRGFTLIEIMVVIVIIGILAAAIAPNIIEKVDQARVTKAKTDIRTLETALKLYRLDNAQYPTTEQGLEALVAPPVGVNLPKYQSGGYLERSNLDPWNNEYLYLSPGQNATIDIFSYGADGLPGGEEYDADIGNWNIEN